MEWVASIYETQPFWLWLGVGVVLLAIESMFSTEWLLWPAVAAGVTAMLAGLFPQIGLQVEAAIFAALTIALTVMSRKLVKRVNPTEAPDINDVNLRLVGQKARVVEPFNNGTGRVYVSGAEWVAEISDSRPLVGENVIVDQVLAGKLKVRAI